MRKARIVSRIWVLFLSGSFALPPPALALRPTETKQSGAEEELTSRLRRSASPNVAPAAGVEEWGEGIWNRLYELNAKKLTPLWEAFSDVLDAYMSSDSSAHIEQLWGDVLRDTVLQENAPLIEAIQAFQRRRIVPVFISETSLLYDRHRKEGVLLVGDERRFQLIVALLEEDSQRWELLAHDQSFGFETDGKLIVGRDPLAKAGKFKIPFDPPTEEEAGDWKKVEVVRRFVPVQRVIWLTPWNLKDTSAPVFQRTIFSGDFFSGVPESFFKALTSQPRTVVPVPTHAAVKSYRTEIVPIVAAAWEEEKVSDWLRSLPLFSETPAREQIEQLLETAQQPDAPPVTTAFRGDPLPAQARLQKVEWPNALQATRLPEGFRFYVQMGVVSEEQIRVLKEWLGVALEMLPDKLEKDRQQEILREIQQPQPGQPGKRPPEALFLLNRNTFDEFDEALVGQDRSKIPAVIVGVREGALAGASFGSVVSYLLELLGQAELLGRLVTDRLEGSFSTDADRTTWFLRSSA